jgi:hypothetical protein
VKKFGYAMAEKIRLYGEEFDVLSDPFLTTEGIAIHVRSRRTSELRVLTLPATLLAKGMPDVHPAS